jgi:hypothetical protein
MGEAKETYIVDPEAASHSMASMAARAEVLRDTLDRLSGTIDGLEKAKPWGTAEEYGGRFEKQYGDASIVRDQAKILASKTVDGATKAHQALRGSVEVDADGAKLFALPEADVARMKGIGDQQEAQHARE